MTEPSLRRAIGRAALVLALGNLAGSVLGFARQFAIANVFGASAGTDAFFAASVIPQMFYDLTIGAAISAALIPTFTEVLELEGREQFRQLVSNVLALALVVLAGVAVVLVIFAEPLMTFILGLQHSGLNPGDVRLAGSMTRVLVLTLLGLGTSAVLLSALYSLRRFRVPAFAGSFYHLGIIGGALLLARPLGAVALPVGALLGSLAQAAVQVPPLIRAGLLARPRLVVTPTVRRIIRLYMPVAGGLLVSVVGQVVDINLKWRLHAGGFTAMAYATTLTQFPIGIAVAAMSFALLPSISAQAASGRTDEFKATLTAGIKFVIFITVPAAIGYLVLSSPVVSLLYHYGKFTSLDVSHTSSALSGYSVQIPFVGIDQLLIFAFYARKNTLTPMIVGVGGVALYVASAVVLLPRFQITGLALANTLQNVCHALVLGALLLWSVGSLRGHGLLPSITKTVIAGGTMAAGTWILSSALRAAIPPGMRLGALLVVLPSLACAVAIYLAMSALLRHPELAFARSLLRK